MGDFQVNHGCSFKIEQIRTCLFPFKLGAIFRKTMFGFPGQILPLLLRDGPLVHGTICIWSDGHVSWVWYLVSRIVTVYVHIFFTCNKDKQGIIYTLDWMHSITITVHVICVYYYTHLHPMPFFVSGYNDNQCICSKDVPAAANAFGTRSHQI